MLDVRENDQCPHCRIGIVRMRHSKYGAFLGCDNFPRCAFKVNVKEDVDVGMAGYKE